MVDKKKRAVAIWLLFGVFMIMVQVFLGGVTRLTGSGLSITDWNPIMGAIPPLNDSEWNKAFDGYKHIAQFKYLNSHFSIHDFKSIFFWEWFHRLWARLLGVVFFIGFIYFLVRKYFVNAMVLPFIILFFLGAVQGLIGWIMVASGLNEENLYVNHIKLAIHFISALILLCYTLWFALQLIIPQEKRIVNSSFRNFTLITIILLGIQLTFGAFMSGLKAATFAPTWPMINNEWIPSGFMNNSWVSDPINVQFIHRSIAYLLTIIFVIWFAKASKKAQVHPKSLLKNTRWFPLVFVLIQISLGILTVLDAPKMGASFFGSYELLALTHQLVAMFLLISLVINLFLVKRNS